MQPTSGWALRLAVPGPGADGAIIALGGLAMLPLDMTMLLVVILDVIGSWVVMMVVYAVTMTLARDSAIAGTLAPDLRKDPMTMPLHQHRAKLAREVQRATSMQ